MGNGLKDGNHQQANKSSLILMTLEVCNMGHRRSYSVLEYMNHRTQICDKHKQTFYVNINRHVVTVLAGLHIIDVWTICLGGGLHIRSVFLFEYSF